MSQTTALVNKLLTNVSNGLFPDGYISETVFPMLSVKEKTGLMGSYGNSHLRVEDDLVGGAAEARRVTPVDRNVSDTYVIFSHALEGIVTEDDYDNVPEPFDAEADETIALTSLILTNKERALAGTVFNPAIITQNASPVNKWDNYSTSDPLADFSTAQNAIFQASGVMPNAAILPQSVYNKLMYHPAILDVLGFKYNQMGTLNKGDLMKALNVDELLVPNAPYNAAVEGQNDSIQQVWGDSVLFYVKPKAAAKRQMSLGYYLKMNSRKSREVFKRPMGNPVNSTAIIVRDDYSFKIKNTACGYLWTNVLASI